MQVLRTPYLNRLKQFYFRLIRNNLYLGKRGQSITGTDPNLCFMCGKHQERRVPLLYSCEVVKKLTQTLIEILKRANLLKNGIYIEVFLFKSYDFNSIENLSLVILWDYIYKSKFDAERYSAIKFEYYLMRNIDQLALLSPNLKLGSQAVVNVLESRRSAAINRQIICDYNDASLRLRPAAVFPGRSQDVPPQQDPSTQA